jgi:hypothetical protein
LIFLPVKIKIVGSQKRLKGAGMLSAARARRSIRPYTLRVSHDYGGGLWGLEDDTGQTYLAVLSNPVDAARRRNLEARRADGGIYRAARRRGAAA